MSIPLVVRRGRPRFVAQTTFTPDPANEFIQTWYEICATFRYRDIVALARGLGISPSAVERWKYQETMPKSIQRIMVVLEWVKRGKPMTTEQNKPKSSMFHL